MADNYLGRKMEEYRARAEAPVRRPAVTLTKLLLRNRSCRGYDPRFQVREDQLRTLIEVNTRIPSARNQQVLRFRPVLGDEARQLLPLIRLGGALPENRYVDMDLGISAQSMLLRAVEIGLNGICIGAFDPARVRELLGLPYDPLLILAVGKGAERIELTEIDADESHAYYRRDGVHYVPKVRLDDLLIERATKDE